MEHMQYSPQMMSERQTQNKQGVQSVSTSVLVQLEHEPQGDLIGRTQRGHRRGDADVNAKQQPVKVLSAVYSSVTSPCALCSFR